MSERFFGGGSKKDTKPRSSIERVVGGVTEKQKRVIGEMMSERFENQSAEFKELKDKERKKTPEELKIIGLANASTNTLRRYFGLPDFDIPAKNIHILRKNDWPTARRATAVYGALSQGVAMQESFSKMQTALLVTHEMIHFKSYNAVQATMTFGLKDYRVGLSVADRRGTKIYLNNLNEALTEELAKRILLRDIVRDSVFSDEKNQTLMNKSAASERGRFAHEGATHILDEDTFCVIEDPETGGREVRYYGFSYEKQRAILSVLIDKLYARHPDVFKNTDAVLEVFARGMMTGNLLEIGRLVDETFGKGTLRKIAETDDDVEGQLRYVQQL